MATTKMMKRIRLIAGVCLLTALTPLSDVRAGALSLDGQGDWVELIGTDFPIGDEPFTIAAWINPTSIPTGGGNGGQMSFWGTQGPTSTSNGFRLRGEAGLRHYFWGNDHDEDLSGSVMPDTTGPDGDGWHHFAITYDGSKTDWYQNGEHLGTRAVSNVNVADGNYRLGSRIDAEFFHGFIDEYSVWNVALSGAEIEAGFTLPIDVNNAAVSPLLVAYYNFEGSLDDMAGGDNNGTAMGDAHVDDGVNAPIAVVDFFLDGSGQTYTQNFDEMETGRRMPTGWVGEDFEGLGRGINSLGLKDGPMNLPADASVQGIANVGGNADSFSTSAGKVATWNSDLTGDGTLNGDDAIADGGADRALGVARVEDDEAGSLQFEIEIANKPLRAFTLDWDVEVWGGDPESDYRGTAGPGMKADLSIGGADYYSHTETVTVGDAFNSFSDGGDTDFDPTLIDGNAHAARGLSSGFMEVNVDDGAVGNTVNIKFDANWGGDGNADGGWITAVDNVQFRAVAAGDVDANGSVDPLDIVELLKGGQFGKGVNGVTWQQGDFNGDDQFDPNDLVAVLTFLSGQFPTTYASEQGNPGDGTPDVIVDYTSGEVIVDFAGHTSSSVIIDSAAGVFNGDAPEWDTMGEFRTASASQLSNTMFNGTESGVDSLGNLVKGQFMNDTFDFNADLTVKILVATPDGPVTVDGHVIVIPEPSTWMLLGLGSLALVAVVCRRRA